jgi:hypothetical protein
MAEATHVYGDLWGEIIDRPSEDLIELRWFDTTTKMSKEQFQQWLKRFADHVSAARRRRVLIDGTSFLMDPAFLDGDWRDANIVPLYNATGVTRFAFHMPAQMPMVGHPPAPEGPARFPTAYFGSRQEALGWLRS